MGVSQEAFADVCGYSRSYMSQIERGVANITLDVVQVLADAFGLEPKALLDFEHEVIKKTRKIRVPFCADGSSFHPGLIKPVARVYKVGEKGDLKTFKSFDEALRHLKTMKVPKWQRPNISGHWGIVSGVRWGYIEA